MTNESYGKLAAGLLAAWFIFSLAASGLHAFAGDPNRPPHALLLTTLTPIALFGLWYATSAGFQRFALSLNARTLTLVQAWRIGGFVFLVLHAHAILPGLFALPAGWGDIAIGATAPFVAIKLARPDRRGGFILWQVLGIADLVMAVTLGVISGLFRTEGLGTGAMTVLPLSLIPTFAVPLLVIFHLICIAQARRWSARDASRAEERFRSSEIQTPQFGER
jgi:hypothetical protein